MKNKNERVFIVKEKQELLAFLFDHLSGKSKNNIKNYLTNRQVLVNDHIVTKHDYILKEEDKVYIRLHYIKSTISNIPIIYEDEQFLVVDKPSGLLCIRDEKKRENLYHLVSDYVKTQNKKNKIFIVHRLDKDTSGLVLFAKNTTIKEYLQKYWNDKVDRFYLALVHGIPSKQQGTIISYLKEDKTHRVYSTNDPMGDYASTYYEVLMTKENQSLLGIKLNTGRKNQIRVHLADMNCPIVGDKKYGIKDQVSNMCLYAYKISFRYGKEKYVFEVKDHPFQTFLENK